MVLYFGGLGSSTVYGLVGVRMYDFCVCFILQLDSSI